MKGRYEERIYHVSWDIDGRRDQERQSKNAVRATLWGFTQHGGRSEKDKERLDPAPAGPEQSSRIHRVEGCGEERCMSCGSYANRNIRKKNEKAQKEISELRSKTMSWQPPMHHGRERKSKYRNQLFKWNTGSVKKTGQTNGHWTPKQKLPGDEWRKPGG